jgi:hypothetical protein
MAALPTRPGQCERYAAMPPNPSIHAARASHAQCVPVCGLHATLERSQGTSTGNQPEPNATHQKTDRLLSHCKTTHTASRVGTSERQIRWSSSNVNPEPPHKSVNGSGGCTRFPKATVLVRRPVTSIVIGLSDLQTKRPPEVSLFAAASRTGNQSRAFRRSF